MVLFFRVEVMWSCLFGLKLVCIELCFASGMFLLSLGKVLIIDKRDTFGLFFEGNDDGRVTELCSELSSAENGL